MYFKRYGTIWIGKSILLSQFSWLQHGITTRKGGTSEPPFFSLNIAFNVQDDPKSVQENRLRLFDAIECGKTAICEANQVHGNGVIIATESGQYTDVDGFVTDQSSLVLTIRTADCVPIFIVDQKQRVIGLVHAGWRGSVASIVKVAVEAMTEQLKCQCKDLFAWVGPSIGPCCYEVGEEVRQVVEEQYIQENKLDLWRYSVDQLKQIGVQDHHIEVAQVCTYCHDEWFFSHRASGGKTGRMLSFLKIKKGL